MSVSKENCFYLGKISKLQGFKGGMLAKFEVDELEDYASLDHFFLDIHQRLTPFFIESLNLKAKNFVWLKLEGIDSEAAASPLVGKEIYLPLAELPELLPDEYYLHDLKGMTVADSKAGILGSVSDVLEYPANVLLQIQGSQGEILIPLRDEFVLEVDKKNNKITVETPDGLIDLNNS